MVVVTTTLIVDRVGAIALTAAGVSTEVAHFQARSALTGVGFTTSGSEHIINHPARRRIVLSLMLVGNAGLVTIIATMVVGFAGEGDTSGVRARVGTLAAGLVVIVLAARSRMIDNCCRG